MKKLMTGVALGALLATTAAFADDKSGTVGGATNSGPGVQGPADTRTGPSTREPGDGKDATVAPPADTGAKQTGPGRSTSPSQDSSGVPGVPGGKSGPATQEPSDSSK